MPRRPRWRPSRRLRRLRGAGRSSLSALGGGRDLERAKPGLLLARPRRRLRTGRWRAPRRRRGPPREPGDARARRRACRPALRRRRSGIALGAFAAALARDGTIAAADGLSFHPYPQQLDAGPFRDAFAQVDAALGSQRARLVADELGASTADRGHGRYQFSDEEQRDVVLASFETMDSAAPSLPRSRDVDAVVFHTDVDGPGGFGFVAPTPSASGGFAPQPVFCAIAQLLRGTGLCGLPAAAQARPAVRRPRARGARACGAARRSRDSGTRGTSANPRARRAAGGARAAALRTRPRTAPALRSIATWPLYDDRVDEVAAQALGGG